MREPFLTNSRIKPTPLKPRQTPLKRSTKPIRVRRPGRAADRREGMSPKHLACIRALPCCITGRPAPSDPHHLKTDLAHERGIGRKATDRWTVPLAREAHESVERVGSRNELAWFQERGIADPKALARDLWAVTGDLEEMKRVLWRHMNGGANP
jgi:hypothetical protein